MKRYSLKAVVAPGLAFGLVLVASPGWTEVSAPPSIDRSLEMQTVGAPKISPDGKHVVYEESRTNWEANAFETDLWIADTATTARHRLTTANKSSSGAAWSPDGKWIAFLSSRPGVLPESPADKTQVWVMPADGGEAQQLTRLDHGVISFAWAPDSRRIGLVAEGSDPKAMKDRKETFGEYHVIHADYAMAHLWLLDLPATDAAGRVDPVGPPRLITPGEDYSVGTFAFSPDGARIAFDAQKDPDLISSGSSDIYVVTLADSAVKKIVETAGPDINPQWSPDGGQIAYETAASDPHFFYANRRIAVVDRNGGSPKVLTLAFDEDAGLLRWAPDGLYFSARHKTEAGLYLLNPQTETVTPITFPDTNLNVRFSFSTDFKHVAFQGAGPNRYGEIYAADLPVAKSIRLTDAGAQLAGLSPARREVISWKSADGTVVEGVLYKPADFDPAKKYPLLVVIHGGPTGVDTPAIAPDTYYPIERFIAKGALVLRPNYRGSAGYGGKFRALNVRNLGLGDYADVISGVDFLISKGFVDKTRIGSMGWSEGGYISAFIATSSDRFKAVSVGAGISDWMTYYVGTDITPFTRQYLLATPWSDPGVYRKTSPITYVTKATTPTLIQHGGADKRVPLANSYELRQALEDQGVPVKMVVYDGFGHPINKPKQQRAVMEENENWFDHYIWGDPLAPALTPRVKAKPTEAP
jgi:dipeptidyl aminopeptidase/acylaminoacyl peptidase